METLKMARMYVMCDWFKSYYVVWKPNKRKC